ncbi:hypothetical protein [Corynebacterium guaraldiae]|nr:hypothetical protein [Corynebacterium guaraldiae]MCG7260550.1 hypothetical protein [Corynebacterium aurimucosum]
MATWFLVSRATRCELGAAGGFYPFRDSRALPPPHDLIDEPVVKVIIQLR